MSMQAVHGRLFSNDLGGEDATPADVARACALVQIRGVGRDVDPCASGRTVTLARMAVGDLVIGGVSAAGSIGASIVALYLARRSDAVRQREREDDAFAQARLVLVEVVDKPHSLEFLALIHNHGREPILDVELSPVLYMPISQVRFVPVQPEDGYVPVR
jgi:hypothetical protein